MIGIKLASSDLHLRSSIKLASSDLHLRIELLKPFLVGAKKTRLGLVSELVLYLSVGTDFNQEDCSLPVQINKDQITNILVSCLLM